MTISYDDFLKVEMRVGQVERVEDYPEARKPAYKLWINFGDLGVKQSSAQLTRLYNKEDLPGRRVVAVVNFAPKQIGKFVSEVLVLGTENEKDVVQLLDPGSDAVIGARVF
jgi:tRNA-binding protein